MLNIQEVLAVDTAIIISFDWHMQSNTYTKKSDHETDINIMYHVTCLLLNKGILKEFLFGEFLIWRTAFITQGPRHSSVANH